MKTFKLKGKNYIDIVTFKQSLFFHFDSMAIL